MEDVQMTSRGYPNFNSYVKNLRILVLRMENRWLHVDTLILIPMLKIYVFCITDREINPGGGGLGNLNSSSR